MKEIQMDSARELTTKIEKKCMFRFGFDADMCVQLIVEHDLALWTQAQEQMREKAAKAICLNCSDGLLLIKVGEFIKHSVFIDGVDRTAHCYAHAILAVPLDPCLLARGNLSAQIAAIL